MNLQAPGSTETPPSEVYTSLHSQYYCFSCLMIVDFRLLSFLRFLFFSGFIFLGYKAIRTSNFLLTLFSVISLIIFFILLRMYDKLERKVAYYKALVKLNKDEAD